MRLSEVVSALSFALDLTGGQPMGHAVRTTLIGMRIADQLGLPDHQRSALYYALMLKDLGCSSNSARLSQLFAADDRVLKYAFTLTDWSSPRDAARYARAYALPGKGRVARAWHAMMMGVRDAGIGRTMLATRCERGADIARMLRLPAGAAETIRALDEHWDGSGMPLGLHGSGIPLLARIASLAQTVEVFHNHFDARTAYDMARARRGRWFDPVMVDCLAAFELDTAFWRALRHADAINSVSSLEPADEIIRCDDAQLDLVAAAFARVIDAKSPFTYQHSERVAVIACAAGERAGMSDRDLRTLRRAALLHDIGKLGVSSRILDKPAPLDEDEWRAMRDHTGFTYDILRRVTSFAGFAAIAASHHERIDGSGYHRGLAADELGPVARMLAVADVAEALSAERPYRAAMPTEDVHAILKREAEHEHLCPEAVDAVVCTFVARPAQPALSDPAERVA